MPPKKQVVAAMERKAAAEEAKNAKAAAQKEATEATEWSKGAKANKKEDEERKRLEALAKKAERDALLAAEEAENSKKKPSAAAVKAANYRKPTTFSVDAALADLSGSSEAPEAFAASNIDDALNLLEITNKGTSGGSQAATGIERHPEKRMKSAWAAFEEREMPILKAENPGLRLSQLKQLLQKKWKKSPENPLNSQMNVAFNATQDEAKDQVKNVREGELDRLRVE